MSKLTTRDRVISAIWYLSDERRQEERSYTRKFDYKAVSDRMDDPPSDRTIRDTLSSLETLGHLESVWGRGMYRPTDPGVQDS